MISLIFMKNIEVLFQINLRLGQQSLMQMLPSWRNTAIWCQQALQFSQKKAWSKGLPIMIQSRIMARTSMWIKASSIVLYSKSNSSCSGELDFGKKNMPLTFFIENQSCFHYSKMRPILRDIFKGARWNLFPSKCNEIIVVELLNVKIHSIFNDKEEACGFYDGLLCSGWPANWGWHFSLNRKIGHFITFQSKAHMIKLIQHRKTIAQCALKVFSRWHVLILMAMYTF